jgi:hypothetical protein
VCYIKSDPLVVAPDRAYSVAFLVANFLNGFLHFCHQCHGILYLLVGTSCSLRCNGILDDDHDERHGPESSTVHTAAVNSIHEVLF